MPPSTNSTCTLSPCVTRSSPRKRGSCSPKAVLTKVVRKKSRGSSSHSETSPRRSGQSLDRFEQLTQEYSQQRKSSPEIDECVHVDLPSGQRRQEYALVQKNDGFIKRRKFGKEGSKASEDVDECIRSMILQSGSLARAILAGYEKEKQQINREKSEIIDELAQLQSFSESAAAELPELRAFHESATTELAQLRNSNEVAAVELENLRLENANLAKKEASTASKLEELRSQWALRDAVNIVAAFIMSKALILRDEAELKEALSSEINQLRIENAQLSKAVTEIEEHGRLQILNLQLSLEAANKERTKLSSEREELVKDKDDREAVARSMTRDLLCRLAAVNEEINQVHSKAEALLREKDDAAARAAHAAVVELEKMKSHNDMLSREMEKLHSTIESTTENLRKLFLEKQNIVQEKAKSEARLATEIAQLLSEKAVLGTDKEQTSARVAQEFQKLRSRCEGAVERLQVVRKETGSEKAKLKSEMAGKNIELKELKKKLDEVQAHLVRKGAEIQRLMKEKEDSHAREIALLKKLESMKVSPRERSDMHIAFLMNWGLLRPDEHSFN